MRAIVIVTPVLLLLSTLSVVAAVTECKDIDCSGRQIECGNKSFLEKPKCELEKVTWEKKCEVKKVACEAVEKALEKL